MRSEAAKKAPKEHYPAPYALIDLWEAHGGSREDMDTIVGDLADRWSWQDNYKNLVFFLRRDVKWHGPGLPGRLPAP